MRKVAAALAVISGSILLGYVLAQYLSGDMVLAYLGLLPGCW